MQQKKIITAILLLAVIGIWGYVGYNVFAGMDSDDDSTDEAFMEINEAMPIQIDAKQELLLNYPDPFLKSTNAPVVIIKRQIIKEKKIEKKIVPTQETSTYTWPAITYKGIMKNQNHPEKILGLVVVNGKECIVRKGESVNDLVVLTIDKNKVELQHEKEKRSFAK